jgi:hypothetical protein
MQQEYKSSIISSKHTFGSFSKVKGNNDYFDSKNF